MQSSTMFVNNNTINKIEFHGIKTVYPVGERVQCFFTIPEYRKPECGDWIGIFPVGWTSMQRDCFARQLVRLEQLNGQYGQVEFETLPFQQMQLPTGQYYQFVYVTKDGEYVVLGSSAPFRFGLEEEKFYQPERFVKNEWFTGSYPVSGGRYGVEGEIQKLQNEIYGLEQGLQGQQQQFGWTNKPSQGVWQPKMVKIEQILKEKIRLEQAQRRLEQLCLLAQLKSCERHIVNVQKREPEIHSFLLKSKMQAKIAVFEQKVNQIVKMTTTSTPAEQYVRKYEQLLREKIQFDMEKRRVVLHKLRLTIKECERKLRELQTVDQEYLTTYHQTLKIKLRQFWTTVQQIEQQYEMSHYNKHFETIMGPFLFEQEKKTVGLFQAQRELTFLINEICGKLQELEFESGCYSTLRIPRISTGLMFNSHPKLAEIAQLEKKIAEQKLKLKLKMLVGRDINGLPTRFVEQLARGLWFGPVVEKLRLIQLNLAKFNTGFPVRNGVSQQSRFWAEKKTSVLSQFFQTFTQFQTEAVQVVGGQQSLFGLFEHIKTKQVLSHLRELKERECMEIIRYFQENTFGQSPVVVELVQQLVEILSEKMSELTTFTQWYEPQHHHQQMPIEWLFPTTWDLHNNTTGTPSMLELFEIERKLVEMKGLALATVHYMHLSERLIELEQFVHVIESVQKRERVVEKIKSLKRMVEEHVEQYTPSFVTIPEQFFAHQQKYEKMCQLVGELECHFIEQVTGMRSTQQFGGEFQQPRFVGLTSVHQKFNRLVREFQCQFPECFTAKIEEIVQFLRLRQPLTATGVYGQELKEKLVEFETILCQPECEIACLATSLFPETTTTTTKVQRECLKYLIRQVRDLKHQVQFHLNNGPWTMENVVMQPQQQQFFGGEESQLVNLLNKNMWINGECNKFFGGRVPQQQMPLHNGNKTVLESQTTTSTTTINGQTGNKTTIVKSLSMPVNNGGLIKPITIEKIIREEEQKEQEERQIFPTTVPVQQLLNKLRFGGVSTSFDLIDAEFDEDEEDFDFGTDAEITISTLLSQPQQYPGHPGQFIQPGMIRIENIINGGEGKYYEQPSFFGQEDSCLCQIEKHIRKTLNGGERFTTLESIVCPLCTVETTTTSTGVVRKF